MVLKNLLTFFPLCMDVDITLEGHVAPPVGVALTGAHIRD
jgi:hypothetical protein